MNLSVSLQIRRKISKETKVFHIVIRVPPRGSFRKGWGCEVFSTRVNVFFLPYFKLRTFFSGYGMILKRENNFSVRVNDPVPMGKKVPMLTPMDFECKMARKRKWKKFVFSPFICVTHLNLSVSLQIRRKTSKETKVFHIVIRVPPRGSFRKGWGCEVFSTRVNVFFLPYFKLRTILSGYGMILKRENNFSDRVNDPVSKGKKVPMLTPMEFWSKMARKRNWKKFVF